MSWSFYALGKPQAVLKDADTKFDSFKCAEPEETIRQGVYKMITASLLAMPPGSAVEVTASGSQSFQGDTDGNTSFFNQLHLDIKPIYNFFE